MRGVEGAGEAALRQPWPWLPASTPARQAPPTSSPRSRARLRQPRALVPAPGSKAGTVSPSFHSVWSLQAQHLGSSDQLSCSAATYTSPTLRLNNLPDCARHVLLPFPVCSSAEVPVQLQIQLGAVQLLQNHFSDPSTCVLPPAALAKSRPTSGKRLVCLMSYQQAFSRRFHLSGDAAQTSGLLQT